MEADLLMDYIKWADNKIFAIISELDDTLIRTVFYKNSGSIRDKLLHLAEEYLAWFYDITLMDYREDVQKIENLATSEMIEQIGVYHKKFSEYIKSPAKTEFAIDEGKGTLVKISLNQVIFNLVNHSTYHRGQIVTLLRMAGFDVPITDFYWFKIHLLEST